MATANIKAVITAEDKASAVVNSFGSNIDSAGQKVSGIGQRMQSSLAGMAVVTAGAGMALQGLVDKINEVVNAANRQQSALIGLSSISKAFGQDQAGAAEAARKLAADGLMPLADAATGLKNLLAAGFSLPQAITLMNRFKDSAAFGRQGALTFGEAIRGATEGIKNGNSILVDNAGVTKNLSMMLEEAGYSAQDLMKATSDAGVRQAIFNGILKETNPMLGDSAKLADTFAGKQSKMAAQVEQLRVKIGEALQPALGKILDIMQPFINAFQKFVENNPGIVAALTAITVGILALGVAIGAIAVGVGILNVVSAPIIGIVAAVIGLAIAIGLLVEKFIGWENVFNALGQIFNTYIKPALDSLWNTIQTQLIPALQALWNQLAPVLIPVLKTIGMIIGGAVLISILAFIEVLKVIISVISTVINFVVNLVNMIAVKFQEAVGFVMWLKDNFWTAIGMIIGFFATLPIRIGFYFRDAIMGIINWFKGINWGSILSSIVNAFANVANSIWNSMVGAFNAIKNINWGSVIAGIGKGIGNALVGMLEGAINGALSGIPGSPRIRLPRFAKGVENFSGGLAIVGEQGPEVVALPRGSSVIPNDKIGGVGSSTTINISPQIGVFTGSPQEMRALAVKILESMKDIADSKNISVQELMA